MVGRLRNELGMRILDQKRRLLKLGDDLAFGVLAARLGEDSERSACARIYSTLEGSLTRDLVTMCNALA